MGAPGEHNRGREFAKTNARKRKFVKGNENNFPFISFQQFFGISTSQWVTGDSNKKIFCSICGCVLRAERLRAWSSARFCASSFYPHPPAPRSAIEFAIAHDPSRYF
jgi:hypothetical protein